MRPRGPKIAQRNTDTRQTESDVLIQPDRQIPKNMTKPSRILLNALHAKSGGGITYLRNMLPRLAADDRLDLHLLIHADQLTLFAPLPPSVTLHEVNFRQSFWGRVLWEQARLPSLARRLGIEVTFSPANFGPLFAPGLVILLRNAVEVGRNERRLTKRLYWIALGVMTALSVRRSRRVIAVSDYAGKSLTFSQIKQPAAKLSIIHHGIDPLFTPAATGADDPPFLLAVGDLYVQKNFEKLIEAFALVTQSHPHLVLKIAGRAVDKNYRKQLERAVQRLGLKEFVEFLGEVSRDDLVSLYQRCRIFVFPSIVETFGQPLAEAMACGATIASSRTTAMPEIIGDAALFFDPSDAEDMARNIINLLENETLSRDLATRGALRAKRFSWDHAARNTADVLVSVE